MAENAEPFPSGPVGTVDKDGKVYLFEAVKRWFEGQAYTQRTDIGSVISGVSEAKAAASVAQATANAATTSIRGS